MTQKKSIIKRIKVTKRNNARNKVYKTTVKNIIKKCLINVQYPDKISPSEIQSQISRAYSEIDKAVQKGVFHRNNGARKKSRLNRAFIKALAAKIDS